ncbi:hypothetical protein TNCV_1989521 [Trichonephila clavipes]|nr:hypothetical protein TNCV_1989521 [Trichonephila clavipes]
MNKIVVWVSRNMLNCYQCFPKSPKHFPLPNKIAQGVVKAPKSEGVVDPKSGERRRVSLPFEWQQGEGRSERRFLEMRLEEADGYERAR